MVDHARVQETRNTRPTRINTHLPKPAFHTFVASRPSNLTSYQITYQSFKNKPSQTCEIYPTSVTSACIDLTIVDRENISKYIPAGFDSSKLSKRNTKPARTHVNFVCPFRSMRCLGCCSFTTKGTKFHNAIKEVSAETYLKCQIIRLHTKCPSCNAAIVIETDRKTTDYRLVSGAKRGYEPWKNEMEVAGSTEARLERLACEET